MASFYRGKKVCITGGAGFVGRHLHRSLLRLGAQVTIGDDLSSGSMTNITAVWESAGLRYRKTSTGCKAQDGHRYLSVHLENYRDCVWLLADQEIVFHLAANIGGRGYIDTHPADCCEGFAINQNIIKAAHEVGVDRVQYASSACVYPTDLQDTYGSKYLLKEQDVSDSGWANADREYGWAKLSGEIALGAYCTQYVLKGVSTRYVTAYGPWENDTHAITMLIRRAVERQDPYIVWGSGRQDRDFTYIDDIVSGTLRACEKITDGSAVNIGTGHRHTIRDVVETVFDILDWRPKRIVYDRSKPEGVKTRALDVRRAHEIMGWTPKFTLHQGLERTIRWFVQERPDSVETIR